MVEVVELECVLLKQEQEQEEPQEQAKVSPL